VRLWLGSGSISIENISTPQRGQRLNSMALSRPESLTSRASLRRPGCPIALHNIVAIAGFIHPPVVSFTMMEIVPQGDRIQFAEMTINWNVFPRSARTQACCLFEEN
jgi:hypothetical protein